MSINVCHNPKFLVIDDAPSSRRLVRQYLKQMGYTQVVEAGNGAEALEKLSTESVSFIISDYQMADISVPELLKQIKENEKSKDIPFLMLSAPKNSSHKGDAEKELRDAGVRDCVPTPLNLNSLSSKVQEVLGRAN